MNILQNFILADYVSRGLELQRYTNEANWAQDGHVLMQPFSHFNFFIRGLLQLSSYLVQQLPARYKISINPDLFLSAFTMENDAGERVSATSWTGAPDGTASDTNIEGGVDSVEDTDQNMDTSSDNGEQGHDGHVGSQLGIHTGQANSTVIRRKLALKWIDRQERRYLFLPISIEKAPDWENMRNQILQDPHGVRQSKMKGKKSSGKFETLKR
jgi:hypothetical protein